MSLSSIQGARMGTVLLICGIPGSGKTWLADKLRREHSFDVLSLDPLYVSFIQQYCPDIYFKKLNLYIQPHYDRIVSNRPYSQHHFGRDFVNEWHLHLRQTIEQFVTTHPNVVVDGYLLHDFKDLLHNSPPADTRVFQIEVINRTYRTIGSQMTVSEIATLGDAK